MKLYARPASPFARKVRVMAREIEIVDQIEEYMLASPEEMQSEVPKYNPLGKIPALILDNDDVLYDSKVICEYLDTLHDGDKYFPSDPAKRWPTLLLQGLADGIGEAVIAAAMNKYMRPDEFVYEPAIDFQLEKVERGLTDIESRIEELQGPLNIGSLSTACAIDYLNFRFPDQGWRDRNPNLAAWFEDFSQRPSMKATNFDMPS
ncbi:MAG: glutathione S-transferase [Rhodospirillaceae bacterium]|jgi:glutathione S-transferase|nr:glutathione S-transferase [Rhodospirillaceae bacterium]MBT7954796.1 glutathione S-transferase [Rhodospirillaceae bacterium]